MKLKYLLLFLLLSICSVCHAQKPSKDDINKSDSILHVVKSDYFKYLGLVEFNKYDLFL